MGQTAIDMGTAVAAAGHYKIHYDLNEGGWFSAWVTIREWDGKIWHDRRLHRWHVRLAPESAQSMTRKDLARYALSCMEAML